MYKFNISAPGTLLLFGKHTTDNKKGYVAASLNMRTKLTFASLPPGAVKVDFIELNFSPIELHTKIPLNPFLKQFFNNKINNMINECELYKQIKAFVNSLTDMYEPRNNRHKLSLQTFFFLLVYIAYRRSIKITASIVVKITSNLPIGEGMGSSASFAACLATCFWRWSFLQKGIAYYEIYKDDMAMILEYTKLCEYMIYKTSNMDKSVISVYGSLLVSENSEREAKMYTKFPRIRILLVWSKSKQKTPINVIRHSYLGVKLILNTIDAISKESIKIFDEMDEKPIDLSKAGPDTPDVPLQVKYEKLSNLIHMNQGLLQTLGISHPTLDIICAIAQDFSLKGKMASVNKAGYGCGYVFILLQPDIADDTIIDLLNRLKAQNFCISITSLCGKWSGVRIE
ncbi:hypothetical protein P5V15_010669 [Pogonomyrmex californicus]